MRHDDMWVVKPHIELYRAKMIHSTRLPSLRRKVRRVRSPGPLWRCIESCDERMQRVYIVVQPLRYPIDPVIHDRVVGPEAMSSSSSKSSDINVMLCAVYRSEFRPDSAANRCESALILGSKLPLILSGSAPTPEGALTLRRSTRTTPIVRSALRYSKTTSNGTGP